jgi:hypothetical protein
MGFVVWIGESCLLSNTLCCLDKMSIPNQEGVYLLRSYSTNGTLYKIGRTSDLKKRFAQYSPNYNIVTYLPVDNSEEMEAKLKNAFNNRYQLFGGKEYFVGGIPEYYVVDLFNRVVHFIDLSQDGEIDRVREENFLLKKKIEDLEKRNNCLKTKTSIIDQLKLEHERYIEHLWSTPEPPPRSITNQNQPDNYEDKRVKPFFKQRTYSTKKLGTKCWVAFSATENSYLYIASNDNFIYRCDLYFNKKGQTSEKYDNIQSFTVIKILDSDYICVDCGERKRIVGWSGTSTSRPMEDDFNQEKYDSMDTDTRNLFHQEYKGLTNYMSVIVRSAELSKIYPQHKLDNGNLLCFMINKTFKELKTENFIRDPKSPNIIYKMNDNGLIKIDEKTNEESQLSCLKGNNVAILNSWKDEYDLLAFASGDTVCVYSRG